MIKRYFQNLPGTRKWVHSHAGEGPGLLQGDHAGIVESLVRRLRVRLAELDRKRRVARAERLAIAHLRGLGDEQLRDVGIAREDIEHAVRHGKASL